MFDVLVNGHKTADYSDIWVANIPQLQSSEVQRDRFAIPERDGDSLSSYYRRGSAYITVTFHAMNILQNKRIIKSVFCNQINERLKSDLAYPTISIMSGSNYDSYFNIKNAMITDDVLMDENYGRVTIQYEVEPFEYMRTDSEIEVEIGLDEDGHFIENRTVTINNEADLCKPLIVTTPFIYGALYVEAKFGAKIQVDSNTEAQIEYMSGIGEAVTKVAYCDTNLMYTYIAQDGITSNAESKFITHNYEDLWIPHGNHDIKLSYIGSGSDTTRVLIKLRKGYAI